MKTTHTHALTAAGTDVAMLESVFSESRLAGGACVSACHASDSFFFLSQEVKRLVTRMLDEQRVNGSESAEERKIDRSLSPRVIEKGKVD